MNSDRAAFLGQANNVLFDVFSGRHHQVRHLVGHDHDEREIRWNFGALRIRLRLQAIHNFFFAHLVVRRHMSHAGARQQRVALFHFIHGPRQNRFGLSHIGYDGVHQVGQACVTTQLHHFRIDHDHAHFIRSPGHQNRCDDRVQTN